MANAKNIVCCILIRAPEIMALVSMELQSLDRSIFFVRISSNFKLISNDLHGKMTDTFGKRLETNLSIRRTQN